MQETSKKLFSSKVSIVGLFAVLTLILTVPLVVLVSQERQDPRGRAQETAVIPTKVPSVQGVGYISGYVYLDENKNGEREAGEKPFPGATVKIAQIKRSGNSENNNRGEAGKVVDTVSTIQTDTLGYFKFRIANTQPASLTYTVTLELPNGYKTINTNPVVFSGMKQNAQEVLQFGLFPLTPVKATVPVSLTPTTRLVRPTGSQQICLQVLTPARNSATRACNTFANSCLPTGWVKDATCQNTPTPTKTTGQSNSNGIQIQGD